MLNSLNRRHLLQCAAAGVVSSTLSLHAEEPYPNKPIKIIVPLPAGGVADSAVRILVEALSPQIKQTVLVENKAGGIFQIGMQSVAQMPADGYSLIHLNSSMVAAQAALKRIDILKQLAPVCMIGTTDGILVGSLNAPFKTTQELIAWAKANPGKLNYGSAGPGSLEHLIMATMAKRYDFTATHVPFKGGPDAMTALVQNDIQVFPTAFPLMFQFGQKVRPLGMLVDKRNPAMPDIPTIKEQGLDLPTLRYWGGLGAPAHTPKNVLDFLYRNIDMVNSNPAMQGKLSGLGMIAVTQGADEFSRVIAEDLKWMTTAVRDANLNLS